MNALRDRSVKMVLVREAVVIVVAFAPTAARALCADIPRLGSAIREAELVFVGTVPAVERRGSEAAVEVLEIWRGPDLPPTVTVYGGPEGPGVVTSVDRSYAAGTTYLFVLNDARPPLRDSGCSATTEWREALVRLRPSDARAPRAIPGPLEGLTAPLLGLGLGVAAVTLLSVLAFRRTRPG